MALNMKFTFNLMNTLSTTVSPTVNLVYANYRLNSINDPDIAGSNVNRATPWT